MCSYSRQRKEPRAAALVCSARPGSALADPGRARIPEGVRFAAAAPFSPRGRYPPLTAALSVLPAENLGTVVAGIMTFAPVRGLTPMRAARAEVENLPKPVKVTESPLLSADVIVSSTASTAPPASRLDMPALSATASTKSCLVTVLLLTSDSDSRNRESLTPLRIWLNHALLRRFFASPTAHRHERAPGDALRDARERRSRPLPGRRHRPHFGRRGPRL